MFICNVPCINNYKLFKKYILINILVYMCLHNTCDCKIIEHIEAEVGILHLSVGVLRKADRDTRAYLRTEYE